MSDYKSKSEMKRVEALKQAENHTGGPPRIWKPVYGAEDTHEVSNDGLVRTWIKGTRYGRRRLTEPRNLSIHFNAYGYPSVTITMAAGRKTIAVHRLIALSFIGPPANSNLEVAHNNGIKTDCRLENLRWATPRENMEDCIKHGTHVPAIGEKNGRAKLTAKDVRAIRKDERKTYIVAREYGMSWTAIDEIRKGLKWKHV